MSKELARFGRYCLDMLLERPEDPEINPYRACEAACGLGLVEFYQAFDGNPADACVEWRASLTDKATITEKP